MRVTIDSMIDRARAAWRELPDDGESKRILPATIDRASTIVKLVEKYLDEAHDGAMEHLFIEPGVHGNVYLNWQTKSMSMLVDIPADEIEQISYSVGNERLDNGIGTASAKGMITSNDDMARVIAFFITLLVHD